LVSIPVPVRSGLKDGNKCENGKTLKGEEQEKERR